MDIKGVKGWHDPHIRSQRTPSVEEYDKWLNRPSNRQTNKSLYYRPENIDGAKIRRVVIMRRQRETWRECAYAVGNSATQLSRIIEMLPLELKP